MKRFDHLSSAGVHWPLVCLVLAFAALGACASESLWFFFPLNSFWGVLQLVACCRFPRPFHRSPPANRNCLQSISDRDGGGDGDGDDFISVLNFRKAKMQIKKKREKRNYRDEPKGRKFWRRRSRSSSSCWSLVAIVSALGSCNMESHDRPSFVVSLLHILAITVHTQTKTSFLENKSWLYDGFRIHGSQLAPCDTSTSLPHTRSING